MEKYNGEEYWDYLSSMNRTKVMQECIKMKKKLCKLSEICDIQDTIDLIYENAELTRKLERKENEIRSIKELIHEEIVNAGGKPVFGGRMKSLLKYLVKVLNRQQQQPII